MLTLLKYAGMVLATCSTLWSATQELSSGQGREKKLTRAGYIALFFTIAGLLLSVISTFLADREAAQAQQTELLAEIRRTRSIILASQPLKSMRFQWTISNWGASLRQQMEHALAEEIAVHEDSQRNIGSEEGTEINRDNVLLPMLRALAFTLCDPGTEGAPLAGNTRDVDNNDDDEDSRRSSNMLLLFSLDEDRNTILSLGSLTEPVTWNHDAQPLKEEPLSVLSGAVMGSQKTTRPIDQWPVANRAPDGIKITWNVNPRTLVAATDRQNNGVTPTARLPETFKMALLFDIHDLPFHGTNLALTTAKSFWEMDENNSPGSRSKGKPQPKPSLASKLIVEVNGIEDAPYVYELKQIGETRIEDDDYGEESFQCRCLLMTFQRLPEN
ncbi:MAG: hypothetical protein ACO1TE_17700 [Prosthecobacter sp.]